MSSDRELQPSHLQPETFHPLDGNSPVRQNDRMITVQNLSKCYLIYDQPQDRLKQAVMPRVQRLFGKKPSVYYHDFWALRDVSFEVNKGETIGVIGRNGSGKSTLLQLICGTLNPTGGKVLAKGRIAALLELGSGFNPEFTGRENVYMNGAVLGLTEGEIDARFGDITAFADIGVFIDQPIKSYSSGMIVRLAFAVQAMVDPDILIVDEALAVGDERFQRKCFARLDELKRSGTSIIFVSHSGPQVVELCDRAILLENGARLMCAEPAQVVRAYQKLIYAPENDQERLVKEYKEADQRGPSVTQQRVLPQDNPQSNAIAFDPSLVPETTTVYPVQGVEIKSFQIVDQRDCAVNILRAGEVYNFSVTGCLLSDIEKIYFGIHIRTTSGVVITGQRYPEEGRFVEVSKAQKNFRITFSFKMILLPGVYFVGGGVWSSGEPACCHRIVDALMFRLQSEELTRSFGYANASAGEPSLQLF